MSPPPVAAEPRGPEGSLPTASKIGLALCGLSLLWWFLYYANYGGAFGYFTLKLNCINGATSECLFFQERMGATIVPTYYPVLWYAGTILLTVGFYQIWKRRRAT